MKKLVLLLEILALIAVMAAVVILGSPSETVVSGPADIEALWAIEDTREESGAPLVTHLLCDGVPMVYVESEDTFYCTLGLETGGDWPQMKITAPQARGLSLCFSDDYTYDWCDEAIGSGYSYELMAYTDKAYDYFNVVFTGLPLVSLTSEQAITQEDTPARVTVSGYGEAPVSTYTRAHLRGGLSLSAEKKAYKIEYTRHADGTGRVEWATPGLGRTDELLLLPMPFDSLLMRDRLSWDLYGRMTAQSGGFAPRKTAYAEVVINGEYAGVYLMMTPYSMERDLLSLGTEHLQDSVYRTCVAYMSEGRPLLEHPLREGAGYELFYSPQSGEPFAPLAGYIDLLLEEDDEVFCQKAMERLDLTSLLQSLILIQAGGMTDNVFNNLYIRAERTQAGYVYHFFPWDMDLAWGLKMEDIGFAFENWMFFPLADRLISLNPGGAVRAELLRLWESACADLNLQTVQELTEAYAHELNASGAMARNAERWGTERYEADGFEISDFASVRFALLDETIRRLAQEPEGRAPFLERTQYEGKGTPIQWDGE